MFVLTTVFLFNLLLSLVLFFLGNLLSKKNFFDRELQSPFECGFSTMTESRMPFSLRFFVLSLIFVIFDVEIIIMIPFLVGLSSYISSFSLFSYTLFLSILTFGLFNEWNQNMLEWMKFY